MPRTKTERYSFGSHEEVVAASLQGVMGKFKATWLGGRHVILLLTNAAGEKIQLTVSVMEHVAGRTWDLPDDKASKDVGVGRGKGRRVVTGDAAWELGQKDDWREDELRAAGLPLYASREWFQRELGECGSIAEMGRRFGYKTSTLENWASRHEISLKPRKTTVRERVLAEYEESDPKPSFSALAESHGVSVQSVSRWVKEEYGNPEEIARAKEERRMETERKKAHCLELWDKGVHNLNDLRQMTGLNWETINRHLERHRGRKARAMPKKSEAERMRAKALAKFDGGSRRIADIARFSGLSESTVYKLLAEERGYRASEVKEAV